MRVRTCAERSATGQPRGRDGSRPSRDELKEAPPDTHAANDSGRALARYAGASRSAGLAGLATPPSGFVGPGRVRACGNLGYRVNANATLDSRETSMNKTAVARWADLAPAEPAYALVANVDLVVIRWPDSVEPSPASRSSTAAACIAARCSPTAT